MRSAARSGAGRAGEEYGDGCRARLIGEYGQAKGADVGILGSIDKGSVAIAGEAMQDGQESQVKERGRATGNFRCSPEQRRASQPRLRQCREEECSGFCGHRCLRAEQREDRLRGRRSSHQAVRTEALLPKQALEN